MLGKMGGTLSSCSFDDFDPLFRSLSFEGRDAKSNLFRSMSFNGHDSEPAIAALRSYGSAKSVFERSLSLQRIPSFKTPKKSTKIDGLGREMMPKNRDFRGGEKPGKKERSHEAALRLQKVYKSFRTRRRLADCAVMVEQRWWKLLDFAELKHSSISFFDIEKPESAISRWSRARTRAAKVGKGLSKDEKARKLALQHWLEAIDPRHRYGHNLQFYYLKWLHCESKEPFFYWLDIGQGKEVNLEICPRSKLQQQCIKYLGPTEREAYEVVVRDGKFEYVKSGKIIDTTGGPKDTKWIFVLSTSKALYVGMKSKGTFQHSSFLAGGATLSAGRLEVENGVLKAVWPHSGHYLPTEENFQEFMSFLKDNNVDLTNVKKSPSEDEDPISKKIKRTSTIRKSTLSQSEPGLNLARLDPDPRILTREQNAAPLISRLPSKLCSKLTKLEILTPQPDPETDDGYETAEESFLTEEDFMVAKSNLSEDEDEIPKDKIMRRIDSHKGMRSYQLAQHLSTRWSTGAGPRIGCMRDYPTELQFRVLEQANLSPRSKGSVSSPRNPSRFFNQKGLMSQNSLGLD